jgi:hypothetical protein
VSFYNLAQHVVQQALEAQLVVQRIRNAPVVSSSLTLGPKYQCWVRLLENRSLCTAEQCVRFVYPAQSSKHQSVVVIKAAFYIGNVVDQDRYLAADRRKCANGVVEHTCGDLRVVLRTMF